MVAAVKGYKLILVMPDSMSIERRRLMLAYGASFDLTPREKGMKGAIARAQELLAATPGALDAAAVREPGQHRGPRAHHRAGNPGRLSRRHRCARSPAWAPAATSPAARRCSRPSGRKLKVFAVEPTASPVISGGAPVARTRSRASAPASFPNNLDTELLDGVIQVDAEPAREMARRCAREEGMLVGISIGATLAAIAQKLPELPAGATVLGFNYDTGERYLSVEGFLPTPEAPHAARRGASRIMAA